MNSEREFTGEATDDQGGILVLALLSLLVGTASGLLVAVFRLVLERADRLREALVVWAHGMPLGILVVIAVPAMAAGLAAFFAATVRAPVTGIILVIEMTGGFTLFLPMLSACFAAMVVPTLLGNEPIYESLRQRTPME